MLSRTGILIFTSSTHSSFTSGKTPRISARVDTTTLRCRPPSIRRVASAVLELLTTNAACCVPMAEVRKRSEGYVGTFNVLTCGRKEKPFAATSANIAETFRSMMGRLRTNDGDGSSRAVRPIKDSGAVDMTLVLISYSAVAMASWQRGSNEAGSDRARMEINSMKDQKQIEDARSLADGYVAAERVNW